MESEVRAGDIACPGEDKVADRLIPQYPPIGRGEDWRAVWRVIPGWQNYVLNPDIDNLQVWSLPRKVPCKGGALRQVAAKLVKPTKYGRVHLCREGDRAQFHVERELYPLTFPDLLREGQAWCRNEHPLMHAEHDMVKRWLRPNVAHWGTRNRICLWCHGDLPEFATNTYSQHYGVGKSPDNWPACPCPVPAQPKLTERVEEDWETHGFIVQTFRTREE